MLNKEAALSDFPEPGAIRKSRIDSGWWFTTASLVLTIALVPFAPDVAATKIAKLSVIGALAAASFFVIWILRLLVKRFHRVITRWEEGGLYKDLYESAASHSRKLEASQELLRRLLHASPSYNGIIAAEYEGKVLLEITRNRLKLPAVGTKLHLLDFEAGRVLGTFVVAKSNGNCCQAISDGDVDPIFRGYSKRTLNFVPSNVALFLLPNEESPNE